MKKTWNVEIRDQLIPIQAEAVCMQSRVKVEARGKTLLENKKPLRVLTGDVLPFSYQGETFELALHGPYMDLIHNGVSQSYRRPVRTTDTFPSWAIPWFSLAMMLPVWSKGGLLPLVLAFFGMWGIAVISRIPLWKRFSRFFICLCIALATWLLYFGLAMLLSGMLFTDA